MVFDSSWGDDCNTQEKKNREKCLCKDLGGEGRLTSRVMVYVKMMNESARGDDFVLCALTFFNYCYY